MKHVRFFGFLIALLLCAQLVTACGSGTNGNHNNNNDPVKPGTQPGENEEETVDPEINLEDSMLVKLNDDETDVGTSGATYQDGILSITKAGTYRLQGKLSDGQVKISVGKSESVDLILDGCEITCKTNAAIYCESAEKLYITANTGSVNLISDGHNYIFTAIGADEPNATIFSDDDITLRGSGKLTVNGNYKNGISSKNDIKIKDITLVVNAANTALRGKDSVKINSGNVTLIADKDGIKTTQTEKADKGFIEINDGVVDITAGDDAMQATTRITINGGKVSATCEGKNFNCDGEVFTVDGCFTEK